VVVCYSGQELVPTGESFGRQGKVGISEEIGSADHDQEVLELLGTVGGDHDVAVVCRLDGGAR